MAANLEMKNIRKTVQDLEYLEILILIIRIQLNLPAGDIQIMNLIQLYNLKR